MKVLMVCLGNICRSPLAEGIASHIAKDRGLDWQIDSAGTSGWHDGSPPDQRSIATARDFDIDITKQVSRKLTKQDFLDYDILVAMDAQNYQDIRRLDPIRAEGKLHLMMNFLHPNVNEPVPDPYYGGADSFKKVAEMLFEACGAMIDQLDKTSA
ncbi:UNVERIFIED_CONTAM: hypothetical protein GTU68_036386 [Idotea baltica]|nr:hypothetical protein [Idotea baltica]